MIHGTIYVERGLFLVHAVKCAIDPRGPTSESTSHVIDACAPHHFVQETSAHQAICYCCFREGTVPRPSDECRAFDPQCQVVSAFPARWRLSLRRQRAAVKIGAGWVGLFSYSVVHFHSRRPEAGCRHSSASGYLCGSTPITVECRSNEGLRTIYDCMKAFCLETPQKIERLIKTALRSLRNCIWDHPESYWPQEGYQNSLPERNLTIHLAHTLLSDGWVVFSEASFPNTTNRRIDLLR